MTYHIPVLLEETIEALNLSSKSIIVDATLGGGGHSLEIVKRISPNGKLIGIDQDINAINEAGKKLKSDKAQIVLHNTNFANLAKVLGSEKVDGILADIGVSSHQIDTPERGFSYMADAELDMRMSIEEDKKALTAYSVVNGYSEKKLEQIIRDYGEERYSRRIAENIIKSRPINTTLELAKICERSVPGNYYKTGGHPAKRTFQAIRIEVNRELEVLEKFIPQAIESLKKGGRLCIITFHSLEDRIVKQAFKHYATECICPPKTPQCICGHSATVNILTKKPITASDEESRINSRSSSAKLRVVEKL
ncbi:MAG: 16S rRNA (cytosine(1402)-N(4))-methyltransferase RsmH [Firmicutes bacterium]|nr:16S rRNA (cytosine(1402)-N(4))-methyltransferase RsmH [Bacillota bacterium]